MEDLEHGFERFNLLTSLLSIINRVDESDTDFTIAQYLLKKVDKLDSISIYTIADECFVSRSSVQRFIKNIGYDSFTQMKKYVGEVIDHQRGFVEYTDHSQYKENLMKNLAAMSEDIVSSSNRNSFQKLLSMIHDAENVVLVCAEDSSYAPFLFQQQLLSIGKLVRILTTTSQNLSLLDKLTEKDLVFVVSVSGNFALAVNDRLKDVKARKILLTGNTTALFEGAYHHIHYIGEKYQHNSRNIESSRNVYTSYGAAFFFDLLFHEYFIKYYEK